MNCSGFTDKDVIGRLLRFNWIARGKDAIEVYVSGDTLIVQELGLRCGRFERPSRFGRTI